VGQQISVTTEDVRSLAGAGDEATSTSAPGAGELKRTVPSGFVDYADPEGGFAILRPETAEVSLDAPRHLTEFVTGSVRIAVRWVAPAIDPEALLQSERARLSESPGYAELAFDDEEFLGSPGGLWEFEFADPADPERVLRSRGRAFVVDAGERRVTFALFVRARPTTSTSSTTSCSRWSSSPSGRWDDEEKRVSGTTIRVTPDAVRGMAGRLRGLQSAFEALDDRTERYAPVAVSGDARLGARILEFGSNWYDRRAEMAKRMGDLADLAEDAAEAYEDTENDRARGVGARAGG
jgi:hypothetical protein